MNKEKLKNKIEYIKKVNLISKKDLKNFEIKVYGILDLLKLGYSIKELSNMFNMRRDLIYMIKFSIGGFKK